MLCIIFHTSLQSSVNYTYYKPSCCLYYATSTSFLQVLKGQRKSESENHILVLGWKGPFKIVKSNIPALSRVICK